MIHPGEKFSLAIVRLLCYFMKDREEKDEYCCLSVSWTTLGLISSRYLRSLLKDRCDHLIDFIIVLPKYLLHVPHVPHIVYILDNSISYVMLYVNCLILEHCFCSYKNRKLKRKRENMWPKAMSFSFEK